MSILNMITRPTVMFDPTNPDHRRWLGEFTRTRSWGHCPVTFSVAGSGNTLAQMQLRLLQYYTEKEFDFQA